MVKEKSVSSRRVKIIIFFAAGVLLVGSLTAAMVLGYDSRAHSVRRALSITFGCVWAAAMIVTGVLIFDRKRALSTAATLVFLAVALAGFFLSTAAYYRLADADHALKDYLAVCDSYPDGELPDEARERLLLLTSQKSRLSTAAGVTACVGFGSAALFQLISGGAKRLDVRREKSLTSGATDSGA